MKEKIEKKIKEVQELILKTEVNPTTYEYIDKLLDILTKLKDFLYFEVNQKNTWLLK